jgi:SH3-like domain-containing protein
VRRLRLAAIFFFGCLVAAPAAVALDYRSLNDVAILYDAPSQKAQPLFVMARHTPVEAVVALDGWLKIRDADGSLAWIEKRFLSERQTVLVRPQRAQVRAQPEEKAALVFEAEKDVVLELLEPATSGWAKVRHRDGQSGYVAVGQVWGL